MIFTILEWAGVSAGYLGAGTWFARTQSVDCWKRAKRRYNSTRNQKQCYYTQVGVRVTLWWLLGVCRLIIRVVEKPVAQAQEELAAAKLALEEWTEAEKFALDDRSESNAKLEKERHKRRVLELEM